jgi:formylglycine-generating enzyme required for sulfatase activity
MAQNISIDIPAINMPKRNPDKKMAKPKPESAAREIQNSMVAVQGGTFSMGCMAMYEDFCHDNEKPAHTVTLSDFRIGKFEVTQEQWYALMDTNPSIYANCARCPVENVSYEDVMLFIGKLNRLTGKTFALPTEAEWEYAARGGSKSAGYPYSGGTDIESVAWHDENSRKTPTQVGSAKPNELGLYDMSGNVWEWCSDWFGAQYYSVSESINPKGPERGEYRVVRGGSWDSNAADCRVTARRDLKPDARNAVTGFRLVLRD